jgi:hypothetical protein
VALQSERFCFAKFSGRFVRDKLYRSLVVVKKMFYFDILDYSKCGKSSSGTGVINLFPLLVMLTSQ